MTRPRLFAAAAAAVLSLAAAAAAQTGPSPSNPPPPPPAPTTAALPFLALAGESDLFEISSSMTAVMKSQNPDVKRFASMLIDHHTRTSNVALAQAKAAGITSAPPPVLGPQKRALLDQLMAASPADFDRVYLQQQAPAHEEALALHTAYAEGGDTPQLRTAAQGAIPFVTQHLKEARELAGRM